MALIGGSVTERDAFRPYFLLSQTLRVAKTSCQTVREGACCAATLCKGSRPLLAAPTEIRGGHLMIPDSAIREFRQSLRGQLFCPGESGYDAVRKIPNAMIDSRPAMIARCGGAADVITSVRFGREHKLLA